jgi:hypothetical protein
MSEFRMTLSNNFKDVPAHVINYYAKFRVLLRVRFLNKIQEDQKFLKQERARQYFRNQNRVGCFDGKDEEASLTQASLQEEINAQERDLEAIDSLISSYSQSNLC